MDGFNLDKSLSFYEEIIEITDQLLLQEEYCQVHPLIIQHTSNSPITDDQLAIALDACHNLESAVFSGIPEVTDRSIMILSE